MSILKQNLNTSQLCASVGCIPQLRLFVNFLTEMHLPQYVLQYLEDITEVSPSNSQGNLQHYLSVSGYYHI